MTTTQAVARGSQRQTRLKYRRLRSVAVFLVPVVVVLLLWEVFSVGEFGGLGWINHYFIPAPTTVATTGWEMMWAEKPNDNIFSLAATTLFRALSALGLAIVIGVPLGIGMARIRAVRWFFDPLVSLAFPVPKVALWPIFVLWFGFFHLSKILLTMSAAIFPIISATYLATRNVDHFLIWSARNMGTSDRTMLWKVVFRAALPEIMTGIQTAIPIAFIVVVLSEMLSEGGLGARIILASHLSDMDIVIVGVVAAAGIGFATIKSVELLRARFLNWHEEADA